VAARNQRSEPSGKDDLRGFPSGAQLEGGNPKILLLSIIQLFRLLRNAKEGIPLAGQRVQHLLRTFKRDLLGFAAAQQV